ncbi:hypothetical protein ACQP1O_21160 [Nocardia sp. CA-151230]|uniref:hypothetical protein n=1 Tax=Nocardia sp. CA-151230 TaxID=3239982 RepID=UPI003D910DF8
MKPLYERSSTITDTGHLDVPIRTAIATHAENNQLGDVLANARAVCETRSVRLYRNGLLARLTGSGDPDREHRTIAILTPTYLVIVVAGDKRGIHVRSARLQAISFNPNRAAGIDSGISVVAHWSGEIASQAVSAFYLGLGDDEAGQAFLIAFREAVVAAKTH